MKNEIETKDLQRERCEIFNNFYNNKMPKRVPLTIGLPNNLFAIYGGQNTVDFQYNYAGLHDAVFEVADKIYSDGTIFNPVSLVGVRPPSPYQILGSQSFVMGNNGYMQHPEVSGMNADEYPELIKDPFAFLIEKVIPRQYKKMNWSNPVSAMKNFVMSQKALEDDMMSSIPLYMELVEKKGYYPGGPMGSVAFAEAPFDFVSDQLRSFSGISMDIRRHKSELKEAVEAVLPLVYQWGLPDNPNPEGCVMLPLHMPTFMREKDFAELWFPTFKTMLEQYAANGVRAMIVCEDDWTRYLDYLQELPAGTQMWFEYGDMKRIKEKLGDKFLIQGLYPLALLKQGSKQMCIDKAKELLDIMMPGGGYLFGFDKVILTYDDVNLDNLAAVAEFVHEYGVYDNPGEAFGTPLNSEGFVFSNEMIKPIKSKYQLDWEGFKQDNPLATDVAQARLNKYDKQFFNSVMSLLI